MIVKNAPSLPFFTAGDATILTEVLHPKNDFIELPYSLAFAKIEPGKKSLPHTLGGSETYIFTAGKGTIVVNGQRQRVASGMVVLVPANAEQYVENEGTTTLCFYCIVAPPWREEAEEVLQSD